MCLSFSCGFSLCCACRVLSSIQQLYIWCAKWCRICGLLLLTVTVVRALPALSTHSHTSKFFGASGVCARTIIIGTVPSLFSCYYMQRRICNITKTHLVPWLTKSIHTRSTKYKDSSFATVVTLLALSRCCNVWCGSMAGIQSSRFQVLPLTSNLKHQQNDAGTLDKSFNSRNCLALGPLVIPQHIRKRNGLNHHQT